MSNIGRNDPCPCGSGKKYKKCHIEKDEKKDQKERQKAALNAAKVAKKENKDTPKEGEHFKHPPARKEKKSSWLAKLTNKVPFLQRKSP